MIFRAVSPVVASALRRRMGERACTRPVSVGQTPHGIMCSPLLSMPVHRVNAAW